ncbi:hypothetical protein B0H13DRAFT_1614307, partial [Mycena leptocephala]
TTSQQLDVLKCRTALRIRLNAFRKLQATYMPRLHQYLTASQRAVWDAEDKEPEATRLFLLCDLSSRSAREKACARGLDSMESHLREGEADEALEQLRLSLRTRTATMKFKIRNWAGQRALTRGQGILRQINIKMHASKLRYRYARQALLKLKDHGEWEKRLRVLAEDDVRALNERALTDEEKGERERLRDAGLVPDEGGIALYNDVVSGETHRTLSWIWYAVSKKRLDGEEDDEDEDVKLHEALRVEWCKAYSRSRRWREELVTVEEEMRRTIDFGSRVQDYVQEHVDRERRTTVLLESDWAPIRARAGRYLRGEDISGMEELVIVVDRDTLRWAEALAYDREEVENDMYQ